MKEITVTSLNEGQRLIRFLERYLKEASQGFIRKMLRKKNITLNGHKADGNEALAEGDVIRLYFADETLLKFCGLEGTAPDGGAAADHTRYGENSTGRIPGAGGRSVPAQSGKNRSGERAGRGSAAGRGSVGAGTGDWERYVHVIYEDEHVLLLDKPAGVLTQKAHPDDVSLNEYALRYLLESGALREEDLLTLRPSVCNRLDRNTSGIVAVGKSAAGLRELSRMFRDRSMHKLYRCLVAGTLTEEREIDGYLLKDERTNMVSVFRPMGEAPEERQGAQAIRTKYTPLARSADGASHPVTLLSVELITGRSHQIRAHLSETGHPIVGDPKYGSAKYNAYFRETCGVRRQLLHAADLIFPEMDGALAPLSGRHFTAPLPRDFVRTLGAAGISTDPT